MDMDSNLEKEERQFDEEVESRSSTVDGNLDQEERQPEEQAESRNGVTGSTSDKKEHQSANEEENKNNIMDSTLDKEEQHKNEEWAEYITCEEKSTAPTSHNLDQHETKEATQDPVCYKMSALPRGRAVIIDMRKTKTPRHGATLDVEKLESLFKYLCFIPVVYSNETAKITDILHKESQLSDHQNYNCFIVYLLCYGESGHVCGSDDELVSMKEILTPFDGDHCPSLKDKPKLFFIQATAPPTHRQHPNVDTGEAEVEQYKPKSDIVLAFVSVGNQAYDAVTEENLFINAVDKVFRKGSHKANLHEMLMAIRQYIAKKCQPANPEEVPSVQITFTEDTLTKHVYFFQKNELEDGTGAESKTNEEGYYGFLKKGVPNAQMEDSDLISEFLLETDEEDITTFLIGDSDKELSENELE